MKIGQIETFISECDRMQEKSRISAQRFKMLNYVLNTLILIGSASVTIDGFFNSSSSVLRITCGLIMIIVQGISSGFSIEKRGSVNKMVSVKFRKLGRKLSQLIQMNASEMDINNTLTRAYQEFDDLDVTMYSGDNIIEFSKDSPV